MHSKLDNISTYKSAWHLVNAQSYDLLLGANRFTCMILWSRGCHDPYFMDVENVAKTTKELGQGLLSSWSGGARLTPKLASSTLHELSRS